VTGQEPEISVIVPAFNARELIGPCLEAIRNQEGIDQGSVELIVVDDGSIDGTAEAARDLCDRLVRLDENRGAAAARNAGAREASADILVFVDADVYPSPRALAGFERLFKERPDLSAVVGRYSETPAAPGLINLYHNLFTNYHHDLSPDEIDWFWGALAAVRKDDFFRVGGFDERFQGASAEDMWLGLALADAGCNIRFHPEIDGHHAHNFTLKSMLINDYKKAMLGTRLRIRGRLPRRAPGFARAGNALPLPLLATEIFLVSYAFIAESDLLAFPALMLGYIMLPLILAVNIDYYRYLDGRLQKQFSNAMFIHWMQNAVMLAGAVAGLIGALLGRSPFGRPGWI